TLTRLEKELRDAESALSELQKGRRMLTEEVTPEDVAEVVAKWTGIPVTRLLEGEMDKLLKMETHLHQRVVGQDEAIEAVANAVRRSRAGLQDPNRPIGTFLFLGPTGVGKTLLARALAEFLFNDEKAMVRLDMSEYMEKHTVARLIGAPPGYVGYEEGGQLTEAVRRRPYTVILFDEIEKAHQDVFNVLLQVMDEGRLTDGQGRTVDFRNTVLIMTSNIGSHFIQELTHNEQLLRQRVMELVRQTFRPEFLNRIDEIVIFHGLSDAQIAEVVDKEMAALAKRLAEKKIAITLTPGAKAVLANEGFDPVYGARPIRRVLQRRVLDPLATSILRGEFHEGERVIVDERGGDIVFEHGGISPEAEREAVTAASR
ncbi:MAG TPA: AAA family ATPase, partial [Candidatus Dormibacteraeota bacterium]|nr:AAA family ATPase [Candidatus Dormibacteraeota bacterium]